MCDKQETAGRPYGRIHWGFDKEPSVVSQIKDYALKDSDEKGYAYSLLIENGDKLFYSKFSAEDVNDFEYSKEQFVSDSLSVFNDWDKFWFRNVTNRTKVTKRIQPIRAKTVHNVNESVIKEIVGHKAAQTFTKRVYTHIYMKTKIDAVNRIHT